MPDIIKEVIKLCNEERVRLIQEYQYLKELQTAIIFFVKQHETTKIAHLEKRIKKLSKRAFRSQVKVTKIEKQLLPKLSELISKLPRKYLQAGPLKGMKRRIEKDLKVISTFTKKRVGTIPKMLGGYDPDLLKVEEKIYILNHRIAGLYEYLENISKFLTLNYNGISLFTAKNYTVDLNSMLVGPIIPRASIVLIDANIPKELHLASVAAKKKGFNIQLKAGVKIIPRKVMDEMSAKVHGKPLVPLSLRKYLTSPKYFDAQVVDIHPTEREQKMVYDEWIITPKGRSGSAVEHERFRQSGEMQILAFALRNQRSTIIILSNDGDVLKIVELFRRTHNIMHNVRVFTFRNGNLRQAA